MRLIFLYRKNTDIFSFLIKIFRYLLDIGGKKMYNKIVYL